MAFQALLFCPDEKTARTVTQVLSELEFDVDPCIEPFAAVKKLMSGHFDALVVDCDNEQNATLLFKSARNSTSNQTSLAVAIVEGQAGVAKAFRIGANLVLTKPINVEQSKGTLRVARGLLRKGEPVKPGMSAAPAVSASTSPVSVAAAPFASIPPAPPKAATSKSIPPRPVSNVKPAAATTQKPAPVAPAAPTVAPPRRPVQPAPIQPAMQSPQTVAAEQVAASSGLEEADQISGTTSADSARTLPAAAVAPAIHKTTMPAPAAKAPTATPSSSFGSGAASAPAPARETEVPPAEMSASASQAASLETASAPVESTPALAESTPAPSFTFGGANAEPEADRGRTKIFIAIATVVLVAVLGYAAYSHFSGNANPAASQASSTISAPSAASPSTTPSNPKPAPAKPVAAAPVEQPATQPADMNSSATTTADTDNGATESVLVESHAVTKSSSPSTSASKPAATAKSAAAAPEPAPLVVKGGAVPHTKQDPAPADTAAPSLDAIGATGSASALSGLVGSGTTVPKPVLQTLNVSQGVSQGLVIKRVQPVYPRTALVMRLEGAVDLTATISKSGDITNVKVLKGDSQLSKAATDAVKQWKYKPYLLNGEPVEITTQITINFKLPN
jgi:TonB family protein